MIRITQRRARQRVPAPARSRTAHDRRRAVEHRHLARRPARLRRQQRPGHDHGHRRADAHASSATSTCATACCNDPDRNRHFQPRGLAVDRRTTTAALRHALPRRSPGPAASRATTTARQGVVCRLNINTTSRRHRRLPARAADHARAAGHRLHDRLRPATARPTRPRRSRTSCRASSSAATRPTCRTSPPRRTGPLRFNVDTQAFVNVHRRRPAAARRDASAAQFLNLHLGARDPEPGKKKLFFANPWAIAFTNAERARATAYVVSAGSDLLVKLNVAADGELELHGRRRHDPLHRPQRPGQPGDQRATTPARTRRASSINAAGTRAYVANFVSRNVSVVDLQTDTRDQGRSAPRRCRAPGSPEEVDRGRRRDVLLLARQLQPAGGRDGLDRASGCRSDGWQSCASCHFKGLTDGVVWEFAAGPRKSVPLNATFNPRNRSRAADPQLLGDLRRGRGLRGSTSATSPGPGPLAGAGRRAARPPPATSTLDPNHGLLIGDNGDINLAAVRHQRVRQAERRPPAAHGHAAGQHRPPSPALDGAARVGARRGPHAATAPLTSRRARGRRLAPTTIARGPRAVRQARAAPTATAAASGRSAAKDFASPPAAAEIVDRDARRRRRSATRSAAQYLNRFLRDIGSFNLGVPGRRQRLGDNIGGDEKATAALVGGRRAAAAGRARASTTTATARATASTSRRCSASTPSPPYYHNGACETLACVRRQRQAPHGQRHAARPPAVRARPGPARGLAEDRDGSDRAGAVAGRPLAWIGWPTTQREERQRERDAVTRRCGACARRTRPDAPDDDEDPRPRRHGPERRPQQTRAPVTRRHEDPPD